MIGTIPATLLYHKSPTHGVPSCYIKFQRFTWLSDHKKKNKKVWWEKKKRKVSHISKLHPLLRKGEWILCNFWSVKKVNPKGSSCKSLHTIIQPPSHIAMLQWCLHEIHKTLNFVKEESFKILILTSFCRDPTDINPLLILIQDLCIFFQVISMT